MELIDGNRISREIIEEIKAEASFIKKRKPTIAFIRVGEDPASISYVSKKQKTAEEVGFNSELFLFPETTSKKELFDKIDQLNESTDVHGILVQAPLPAHIQEREAFNRVAPEKDVDGFNAANLGKLCQDDESGFVACTPLGIVELIKRSNIQTDGKHVVVLGRSLIVGKPAALLMLKKSIHGNATVTVCHSRTHDLKNILKQADMIIAAIGKARFVKADMVKKGAVVIDVGINRVFDSYKKNGYEIVGDVDFEEVSKIAGKISPVPGGVGPMTVAMLMSNTLKAYKQQNFKE